MGIWWLMSPLHCVGLRISIHDGMFVKGYSEKMQSSWNIVLLYCFGRWWNSCIVHNSITCFTDEECVPAGSEVLGSATADRRHDCICSLRCSGSCSHSLWCHEKVGPTHRFLVTRFQVYFMIWKLLLCHWQGNYTGSFGIFRQFLIFI